MTLLETCSLKLSGDLRILYRSSISLSKGNEIAHGKFESRIEFTNRDSCIGQAIDLEPEKCQVFLCGGGSTGCDSLPTASTTTGVVKN